MSLITSACSTALILAIKLKAIVLSPPNSFDAAFRLVHCSSTLLFAKRIFTRFFSNNYYLSGNIIIPLVAYLSTRCKFIPENRPVAGPGTSPGTANQGKKRCPPADQTGGRKEECYELRGLSAALFVLYGISITALASQNPHKNSSCLKARGRCS